MPLSDPFLRKCADHYNLYKKICRKCGALNCFTAEKCRNCRSYDLRQKNRER